MSNANSNFVRFFGVNRVGNMGTHGCDVPELIEKRKAVSERLDLKAIEAWTRQNEKVRDAYHKRMFKIEEYDRQLKAQNRL